MTLPIVGLGKPAHHVSAEYYYRIPVAKIPKTHRVYAPDRLRATGLIGYGFKTRPVRGHEFGLKLSADDKKALIAYLKTL